jgi:hypothetical protein
VKNRFFRSRDCTSSAYRSTSAFTDFKGSSQVSADSVTSRHRHGTELDASNFELLRFCYDLTIGFVSRLEVHMFISMRRP